MASTTKPPILPPADVESFSEHLKSSKRIIALLGAGLSVSSGLPTFRGAGGLWRNHDPTTLATPEAFSRDPGLVWQFYSHRRHMALQAKPNRAHYALAELARRKEGFITLSQNVDGLSQRANHPQSQLHLLHGSLFDIKCTNFYCNYSEQNNFKDPIVSALALPTKLQETNISVSHTPRPEATISPPETTVSVSGNRSQAGGVDISDEKIRIPQLGIDDLPHCPLCKDGLLRPGVVWFGEMLPHETIEAIEDWIAASNRIDLILVIGTSAKVYPAAAYVDEARNKGARVAVINIDRADTPGGECALMKGDWFFEGNAGDIVPEILKSVIGDDPVQAGSVTGPTG